MAKRKTGTVKLKAMKLLADPKVKAAYGALAPQYMIARSVIRALTPPLSRKREREGPAGARSAKTGG